MHIMCIVFRILKMYMVYFFGGHLVYLKLEMLSFNHISRTNFLQGRSQDFLMEGAQTQSKIRTCLKMMKKSSQVGKYKLRPGQGMLGLVWEHVFVHLVLIETSPFACDIMLFIPKGGVPPLTVHLTSCNLCFPTACNLCFLTAVYLYHYETLTFQTSSPYAHVLMIYDEC